MAIPEEIRRHMESLGISGKKHRRNVLAITVVSVPFPVETTLEYDPETEVLSWRASLLKGKKKRQAFAEKLRDDQDFAHSFDAMAQALSFGQLLADPEYGPVVEVHWPRCAMSADAMRRAMALMRDAAILSDCVQIGLDGGDFDLTLEDVLALRHRHPDWRPDGLVGFTGMFMEDDKEDMAHQTRDQQRLLDRHLLEIHEALAEGDIGRARALAEAIGTATPTMI